MKSYLLIAAAITALSASAWVSAGATPESRHPLVDVDGNQLYMFFLREDSVAREDSANEAPARSTFDPANRTDIYGWHKPNARALVKRIERILGIKAFAMTSHAIPTFSAYVSVDALADLKALEGIEKVVPLFEDEITFSYVWNDVPGTEIVPWGIVATGTNDATIISTPVYVIDGGVQAHNDLNRTVAPVNPTFGNYVPGHATHVAGIVGARANNVGIRGVNSGAPVISVNIGNSQATAATAMDWVLADAEQQGIFAVANISSNGSGFSSTGTLRPFMRTLSTRLFVAESAGNDHVDACGVAFGLPNPSDGIMVVGGIGQNGEEALLFNNAPSGYGNGAGSNWGGCVDVWAPSQRVLSTWNTSATATMELSGTSMAAPHVAALAARYGNSSTSPVLREWYVRAKVFATGYHAYDYTSIVVPSYTQPLGFSIPTKLTPASISADATMAGTSTSKVVDGLFLTGSWSAGHAAPGWIEFDFGSVKSLSVFRLVPEQATAGAVVYNIYAGNSPAPTTLINSYSGAGGQMLPISGYLLTSARYVRITTQSSPSFVAWREIEFFGF